MNITIFGASGRTGQQLIIQALERGHRVTAYVRRADAIVLQHPDLRIVTGTLDNTNRLQEAISGADACLSALGGNSLTRPSAEFTAGIDQIVTLMEQVGVPRIVYLSSIGAGDSKVFLPQPVRFLVADVMLRIPLADHHANEMRMAGSKLKWTVVRPGGLTDGPQTGDLKHGYHKIKITGNAKISRSNVASFMLDQLKNTAYINKAVWLQE